MPSIINTNMVAITSQHNAATLNQQNTAAAQERLASGLRINSAKDDAAGLAIAGRMGSAVTQVNGTTAVNSTTAASNASNATNSTAATDTADKVTISQRAINFADVMDVVDNFDGSKKVDELAGAILSRLGVDVASDAGYEAKYRLAGNMLTTSNTTDNSRGFNTLQEQVESAVKYADSGSDRVISGAAVGGYAGHVGALAGATIISGNYDFDSVSRFKDTLHSNQEEVERQQAHKSGIAAVAEFSLNKVSQYLETARLS